ncbi:hypothetical protein KR222_006738 [Zaprionus bogoriensis]|nr:hypothetical protein KR222_006738 [Zaprionus bogoriensis]
MLESDAIVYLDLRQHVAIASSEPTSDAAAVENDAELRTELLKFLGLVPARRRLYNPIDNYDLEDGFMDEDTANKQPGQRSRLWASTVASAPKAQPKQPEHPEPLQSQASELNSSRLTTLTAEMSSDMKLLLINEKVQRINAICFENQTPQHIKEPIDLSCLPSQEQRDRICKQHHEIVELLQPTEDVYSFVNSLLLDVPPSMCHPLAVNFLERDLRTCKASLARTLFNMLNHTIFHCGLRPNITWTQSLSSSIEHCFEAGGQRMSRIILSNQIKHPGGLIKPLLHEMCHAAAFVYHGEAGHADNCRKWAYRAKSLLPELPQIDDCDVSYRYTCLLCRGQAFGICSFQQVEQQLRCHYCQFEVVVEPYSVDNIQLTIGNQLETPYKRFVLANYPKCEQSSHSSKMRSINAQYMHTAKQM